MPFKKGQSGNPGGRPKEDNEATKLAKKHTKEAIVRLVYWMQSENSKASVSAAQTILNRAHGTPPQTAEVSGPNGGAINITVLQSDERL